jgi:hypothetical protein
MTSLATVEERRDALVERLFDATLGAFDLLAVYLGDRLGLYHALAEQGATPASTNATRASGSSSRR